GADPAAEGRDPDRLRLCGAHGSGQPGGRREDQRARRPAVDRDRERRPGAGAAVEGTGAAAGVAQPGDHRQGAGRDPPPPAQRGTRPVGRAGAQIVRRHRPAPARDARRQCAGRGAQAAETARRGRADAGDRAPHARRCAGDGGADARFGGRRPGGRPTAIERDLDPGAGTRGRLRTGRMLPPGARRPHRRLAPPGCLDRGPCNRLPGARRARRTVGGGNRLDRRPVGRKDRGRRRAHLGG
ncbi:hypothetical protein LTR94_030021, partial [Friedmanniomyces endolithicus]